MTKDTTLHTIAKRMMLLLLMMTLGVGIVWGQTLDRSGVYYIANNADNDFYLYKSTDLYAANQPYLTTLKTISDVDESAWKLQYVKTEDEKDYYYIIHDKDAQYLTLNTSKTTNPASLRVHLQSQPGDNDNSLFYITGTDPYCICPKNDTEDRSLAPAGNNYDQADANDVAANQEHLAADETTTINTAGLIGFGATDATLSQWEMISAPQCTAPVIKFNYPDGTVTITTATEGTTIYYTTDGTNPSTSNTRKMYDPNYLPQVSSGKIMVFKACAIKKCKNKSDVTTQSIVYNPTIILTEVSTPIIYNGDNQNPTISSVSVSVSGTTTPINTTEYTVSYIKDGKEFTNCKDAGTYTVALKDKDGGDYVVYGTGGSYTINKMPLTITAQDKTVNYGEEINNSVSYSVFAGEENQNTAGVLSGKLTYSYNSAADGSGEAYTPPIPVTSCSIIPSGLTAQNYDITFAAGTLTVNTQSFVDGTNLADGYTVIVDGEGKIVLKYNGAIVDTRRYTATDGTPTEDGKYTTKTITGAGNLTGSATIKIANVNFVTDDEQKDWYATFVAEGEESDPGHALPEGMSAYIISSMNTQEHVAIAEALTYIPKGVPVLLLYGAPAAGFVVNAPVPDTYTAITDAQINDNKLKIVKETTEGYVTESENTNYQKAHFNKEQIYVLYRNEFVLNEEGYLGKGKIYMENPNYIAPSPSPAPARLQIAWERTAGIEDVRGKMEEGENKHWYTLDGRRLSEKPTKKGLYINNGRIIVVR